MPASFFVRWIMEVSNDDNAQDEQFTIVRIYSVYLIRTSPGWLCKDHKTALNSRKKSEKLAVVAYILPNT